MPTVNHKQIQEGVIEYLQGLPLGLSTLKGEQGEDIPAVIKDRLKMPRPNFPYIVVDVQFNAPQGGTNIRDEYVDDDDVIHYVSEHAVTANLSCYGVEALSILHTAQQYLLLDLQRVKLRTLTGEEAVYQNMSEVVDKPMFIETDYIDGSEMDINFTVVADFFDPDAPNTIISTVEVDGVYVDALGNERTATSISVSDTDT